MAAPLYSTESGRLYHAGQILVSCVGLPARGKTHIARSLLRYLRWLGVKTEVFSLGDYRRKRLGQASSLPADYFSTGIRSSESEALRAQVKKEMSDIILRYFREGGQVAIYDANNTTKAERMYLRELCADNGINIMFIETICSDAVVEKNIRAVKLQSPDYKGWDPEKAVKDYWNRIQIQARAYEPIEQPSFPYVKVLDVGERIIVNNINGYLQSRTVFFLMNIHNKYRRIYFARSGDSYAEHSYKADAGLSEVGETYATALRDFLLSKRGKDREDPEEKARQRRLVVWTSSRRRCTGTARPFLERGYKVIERAQMTEINPGVVDGLSRHEIKALYPEEYEKSIKEPYSHRFPRAESYHDLSVRLEPNIFELERDRNDLLIIGHGSVLRCLFAYLKGLAPKDIPKVMIERGDLVEILPSSYGVTSKTWTFWRPPVGHEDFQVDPGTTQPGIYGSPVVPPGQLHTADGVQIRSPASMATAMMERTPRLRDLTLSDKEAEQSRPASAAGVPSAIRTSYMVDKLNQDDRAGSASGPSALQRTFSPPLSPKSRDLRHDQEQGDDDEPEGNPDNSCEWGKAKPMILQQILGTNVQTMDGETTARPQPQP